MCVVFFRCCFSHHWLFVIFSFSCFFPVFATHNSPAIAIRISIRANPIYICCIYKFQHAVLFINYFVYIPVFGNGMDREEQEEKEKKMLRGSPMLRSARYITSSSSYSSSLFVILSPYIFIYCLPTHGLLFLNQLHCMAI